MASTKKLVLDTENRIGTTESGEIAFNLDAFDRLYKGNIIITKRLTDKLVEKLIEHQDKVILHLTCTGMGGTRIEPFVPSVEETHDKFVKLIEGGFPISHVVLRVVNTFKSVLNPLALNYMEVNFMHHLQKG